MLNEGKTGPALKGCRAFVFLFFLILLIYCNTFYASWHMDDYHVIINNSHLHIIDLQPRSLIKSFFAHPDQQSNPNIRFYRPLSCLSLAINWYFGRTNVVGYHLVNITIHFLTAFFLFLTVYEILKLPNLRDKYHGDEYFIALLTSSFWAINPIQTQAVTYIVQRMASMAAMFYLLSLFFYIKGRTINSRGKKYSFFIGCFVSFLFGLTSKENAILLPIALVLIEATFFQDLSQPKTKKIFFWMIVGGGIFVIVLGSILFLRENPLSVIMKGYGNRFYSPIQRLMTEPRILMHYLSQIFYPVPTRLSIEHDITISTSLFDPWTTLPSIVFVLSLICLSLWNIRKMPILSFAILFFFIHHSIESTVLNLEPVFEHRNYLPSLFLFLPVSIGIKWLMDYYRDKDSSFFYILVCFLVLLLVGVGSSTYIRNMAWATEKSLWEDAVKKAPGMMRPVHNLAWGYYERNGHYDKALELYESALHLKAHRRRHPVLTFNSMANIYIKRGDYRRARDLWKEALKISQVHAELYYGLAMACFKLRDWAEAMENIETAISKAPENHKYFNLKGLILLNQNMAKQALPYFRKALKLRPDYKKAIPNIGKCLRLMGEYKRAELFFKLTVSTDSRNVLALLWLIESKLRINDREDADRYFDRLFSLVRAAGLVPALKGLVDENLMAADSQELLIREIAKRTKEKSQFISELGTCRKK